MYDQVWACRLACACLFRYFCPFRIMELFFSVFSLRVSLGCLWFDHSRVMIPSEFLHFSLLSRALGYCSLKSTRKRINQISSMSLSFASPFAPCLRHREMSHFPAMVLTVRNLIASRSLDSKQNRKNRSAENGGVRWLGARGDSSGSGTTRGAATADALAVSSRHSNASGRSTVVLHSLGCGRKHNGRIFGLRIGAVVGVDKRLSNRGLTRL